MNSNQLKLIYFSATGTTQKVLESIAHGLGITEVEHVNLTLPGSLRQTPSAFNDELVIIGAPVYGGRLPVDAVNRLKQLQGHDTPAILIVVYGNREFEDALLELKNLAIELGFQPVAAAAFIGEHSFATKDTPIANGRPDELDVQKAIDFGMKIKEKIPPLQSTDKFPKVEVPGVFPYNAPGARPMKVSPVTLEDKCVVCGTCASVCPTEAITVDASVTTLTERCIRCCACIKSCPSNARSMEDPEWKYIANWLKENCHERKEPQFYGIDL